MRGDGQPTFGTWIIIIVIFNDNDDDDEDDDDAWGAMEKQRLG